MCAVVVFLWVLSAGCLRFNVRNDAEIDVNIVEVRTYVDAMFGREQLDVLHCVIFYNTLQQIQDRILYQSTERIGLGWRGQHSDRFR